MKRMSEEYWIWIVAKLKSWQMTFSDTTYYEGDEE